MLGSVPRPGRLLHNGGWDSVAAVALVVIWGIRWARKQPLEKQYVSSQNRLACTLFFILFYLDRLVFFLILG